MSVLQLTMISYVLICSGSYGIEVSVKSAGPIYAIVGVILTTILISIPQATVCAILSIFYPKNGSTVQWINCIHTKPKIQRILKLIYANTLCLKSIIDNSTYPTMFSDYLAQLFSIFGIELPSYSKYLVSLLTIATCFLINFFGIRIVEIVQYIFILITILPILIECIYSWTQYQYPQPQLVVPDEIDWSLLLSTLLWCCSGFDQLTDISGEVYTLVGHERQYVIAFMLVCLLQTFTYIVPIISLYYIEPNITQWNSGAFVQIAQQMAGQWLGVLLGIGGCMSAFGISNNCITCAMQEFQESCNQNLIPFNKLMTKKLKISQKYNIHLQSLIVITIFPMIISVLGFEIIVELDGFLISMAMWLSIIFYWIRVWQSDENDEYLQLSKKSKIIFTIIGISPFVVNIMLFVVQGWQSFVLFIILQLLMFILYGISSKVNCNDMSENDRQIVELEQGTTLYENIDQQQ